TFLDSPRESKTTMSPAVGGLAGHETGGPADGRTAEAKSRLARWLRVPPPAQPVARWYVSPVVDALAYHWSWLLILVPLLCMGDRHPADYRLLLLLVVAGNFTHQAVSLPFVYLDREVFARHRRRVTVLPLVLLVLFAGSVVYWKLEQPAEFPTFRWFILAVGAVAYSWNFWHVYMQKYGILRLYNAKAGEPDAPKVPGWVDRLLVFAWLPLTIVVVATNHGAFLVYTYAHMGPVIAPVLGFVDRWAWLIMPASVALVAGSLATFLLHEARVNGLRNAPRLSMGLGMTLLSASIVTLNPIKAVIAFGFSHVLEYFVFVWAYQRRYYHAPLPHRPVLGRLLGHPALAFGGFILVVGGAYFVVNSWSYLLPKTARPVVAGVPLATILALLAIYQSMVHFYFDGFLWKMRRPQVRAHL
ncbi:MAG: hypothetical protein ACREMB_26440, partial [Candidatus Rokuibacteriota bacterium]